MVSVNDILGFAHIVGVWDGIRPYELNNMQRNVINFLLNSLFQILENPPKTKEKFEKANSILSYINSWHCPEGRKS